MLIASVQGDICDHGMLWGCSVQWARRMDAPPRASKELILLVVGSPSVLETGDYWGRTTPYADFARRFP